MPHPETKEGQQPRGIELGRRGIEAEVVEDRGKFWRKIWQENCAAKRKLQLAGPAGPTRCNQ